MENMNEHKGKKKSISYFLLFVQDSCNSFPKKTGYQRNNDTDNYHGGDGDVYLQVGPVNDNITRQAAEWQLPQPWPE
jgi:hypothetical protein